MIIKTIEIQNFRSYYKENKFELVNGLNLILGANGDGKTTFYEALEWLFRTDGTQKMDTKYISKKRCEDLFDNESDMVRVAMSYEHDGKNKTLEKQFRFMKAIGGEIGTSNYEFNLIVDNGIERSVTNGIDFDRDLASEVRQFIMFKGEADLDIFQRSNALKMLTDTFSDIKNFEAYFSFMEYAKNKAEQARDNAQNKDRKNNKSIETLQRTIEEETGILSEIERDIRIKSDEVTNFETLLKNLENSKEASEQLKLVNRRIESLASKRTEARGRIKEDYTINLLDDMWILLGFESIANEYSTKVSYADKLKRKLDDDHKKTYITDKIIHRIQKDFVPLPVHIPGQKIMEEMIQEEVCKICGRPAQKHTEPWNYMVQRLEEYKASLKVSNDEDEQIPPLYKNNYIDELQKRDTILNDNLASVAKTRYKINETIKFNADRYNEVRLLEANLEKEYEQKKRILAHSDGLSEEQLLANFENVSNWTNKQRDAEDRIKTLKIKREQHRAIRDDAEEILGKLAKGTSAEIYANAYRIISKISDAFKDAKELNKKKLLTAIEDEANNYLAQLNIDDFKGTIRIKEKANGQAEAILMNDDDTRIFNPNAALRTTYLMSVLFAIGKIASKKKETPYPLLFDAPTSSFTGKKEADFFNVISGLDKQVIIVTKSFLKDAGHDGIFEVDYSQMKNLKSARLFRIEKKRPFVDKKLGTIQTVVTQIR